MNTDVSRGSSTAGSSAEAKKSRILLPVLLVIIVLVAAFGAFNLINGRPFLSLSLSGNTAMADGNYELFGPEEYTVNLADIGQRRYLKVDVALAYANKQLCKELEKRQAQIRDLLIATLRSHSADNLSGSDGLEVLREEILTAVNNILDTGRIKEVYFTNFLVQ